MEPEKKYTPKGIISGITKRLQPQLVGIPASEVDRQKYDVFVGMSSVVKDFVYTGINRVSIHDMIREMVYQRELEKLGAGRKWIEIAIAIFIILIAAVFAIRLLSGLPGIMQTLTGLIPGPDRIAP